MNYIKIATAELLTCTRWLLMVIAYVLEATAQGLDWVSDCLGDLRDRVRR